MNSFIVCKFNVVLIQIFYLHFFFFFLFLLHKGTPREERREETTIHVRIIEEVPRKFSRYSTFFFT